MKFDWNDTDSLSQVVAQSKSKSDVLKKLGLRPTSNIRTLNKYIALYNIDISHFNIDRPTYLQPKQELKDILVENSTYLSSTHLRNRLVKEKVLEYKCRKCDNNGWWMGKPLPLELDHENGNHRDNRIENLRLLCPNCHSQTDTWAGRNK